MKQGMKMRIKMGTKLRVVLKMRDDEFQGRRRMRMGMEIRMRMNF